MRKPAGPREYDMATNTMDDDVDQPAAGEAKDTDLESEVVSLRDRLMRALAETENTRRQGERREQDAQQYATEAGKGSGLIEGVAAIERILTQILNRFGVEELNALNEPFDPMKHEAVMETDKTDRPPGSVAQVLENGYTLHDRLLRPARVVVAKPQQPSSQAERQ